MDELQSDQTLHVLSGYRAHNPSAGERFLESVEATVEDLLREPGVGHEAGFRRAAGYRSWPVRGFSNHLIFYKVRGNEVIFARLVHGARDLPRIVREE